MRNIYRHIIFLCLFTQGILTGCSSGSETIPEELPEEHYITFNNNVSYKAFVSSRNAITGTVLPNGAKVGLYALKTTWEYYNNEKIVALQNWSENKLQTNLNNEPYLSKGHKKLTSVNNTQPLFPNGDNAALYFYGYYPYSPDISYNPVTDIDGPKLHIDIKETMEETTDYLFLTPKGAYPTGKYTSIDLEFQHALSVVRLQIHSTTGTQANCPKLKKVQILTKNNQSGWMTITTGKISFEEQTSEGKVNNTFTYEPQPMFSIYQGGNEDTGAHFMLIPSDNCIDSIVLTIVDANGNETEQEIYKEYEDLSNYKTLKQGYIYTIKVEYGKRTNFRYQITDWEENANVIDKEIGENNIVT